MNGWFRVAVVYSVFLALIQLLCKTIEQSSDILKGGKKEKL